MEKFKSLFNIQTPEPTHLLLFFCALFLLVIATVWIRFSGKGAVQFMKEAHSDPTNRADLKFILATLITILGLLPLLWARLVWHDLEISTELIGVVCGFIAILLGVGHFDYRSALNNNQVKPKAEPKPIAPLPTKQDPVLTNPVVPNPLADVPLDKDVLSAETKPDKG